MNSIIGGNGDNHVVVQSCGVIEIGVRLGLGGVFGVGVVGVADVIGVVCGVAAGAIVAIVGCRFTPGVGVPPFKFVIRVICGVSRVVSFIVIIDFSVVGLEL